MSSWQVWLASHLDLAGCGPTVHQVVGEAERVKLHAELDAIADSIGGQARADDSTLRVASKPLVHPGQHSEVRLRRLNRLAKVLAVMRDVDNDLALELVEDLLAWVRAPEQMAVLGDLDETGVSLTVELVLGLESSLGLRELVELEHNSIRRELHHLRSVEEGGILLFKLGSSAREGLVK